MISTRESLSVDSQTLVFKEVEQKAIPKGSSPDNYTLIPTTAIFELWENDALLKTQEYHISEYIGNFLLKELFTQEFSGLRIVYDPGFLPGLFSICIIGVGIMVHALSTR